MLSIRANTIKGGVKMSVKGQTFVEPVLLFETEIDKVQYGIDHACGRFIRGYRNDELVVDRDAIGCGCVAHPLSLIPLTKCDFFTALSDLGFEEDAWKAAMDLPI